YLLSFRLPSRSPLFPYTTLFRSGLILDVELAHGGQTMHDVPPDFQGFAYLLDGAASFGANRARAETGQLALMGPGESLVVDDAVPGTRYLLMAGKPYGEEPRFNGPFVD